MKASSEFCSPCGQMFIYTGVLFPVRSDCSDFDSSTPEGMRVVLGAELKFMGHDRKLSLLPPAPPQPHRERACTQATISKDGVHGGRLESQQK